MISNKSFAAVMLPPMIAGMIALIINWRVHRDVDGVGWWPGGTAVSIVGAALRSLEGEVPDGISILLAGLLIVGGQLLVLLGLNRFAGKPMFTRGALLVLAGLLLGMSYFTWTHPAPVLRTLIFTVALAVAL